MNRYERELKAIDQKQVEHATAIQELYALEEKEDRSLTPEERLKVEENTKAIRVLDEQKAEAEANLKTIKDTQALAGSLGPAVPTVDIKVGEEAHDKWMKAMNEANKGLGDVFVESKGYQEWVQAGREGMRGQTWTIPGAEQKTMLSLKGTLGESGAGGGGVYAAPVPQVVPGVVQTLFRKMTFADLLMSGQASTSSLRYVVEGTATSGAAGVAEGGTKPESTLGFTTTDEPIKKIATMLPVTEEMLEDAPAIQAYINQRLTLFVQLEEERQLIRGASGGAEVQGLLTSRSVPVYAGGTAAGNKAVQLFKAINGMRGSAFLEADWIALHPGDWEDIRLLTDTAGQFFGGGPFQGPYGSGTNVSQSGQVQGQTPPLWNVPVYVTPATGATKGTAVVGTRTSAQVWRRGGINVDATNSHSTWFQLNITAIRAEERLGLAVYRPTGFVEVRLA